MGRPPMPILPPEDGGTTLRKAFIVVILLLSGCGGGGSLTKDNYLKIHEGMQLDEAEMILGPHTADDPPSSIAKGSMTWKSKDSSVIVFYDGRRRITGKMQSKLE